jgi:phage terminase small subunit
VEEYLVDLNGTQAAIRARYSRKSAGSIACENLTKPHIARAIDEALSQRPGATRARIVDELARIAFSDIRKVVSWRPEVSEAEGQEGDEPTRIMMSRVTVIDSSLIDPDIVPAIAEVSQNANGAMRVKLHDKVGALERLGRALGMFKDRVEVTGKNGAPLLEQLVSCSYQLAKSPDQAMSEGEAPPNVSYRL